MIFNNLDSSSDELIYKFAEEIESHYDYNKQFWKVGKEGYKEIIM